MNGKAAPAGADLGDAHARFELQLGGGVNEFVALRVFKCVAFGIAKISAGILHVVVEKQPVQVARQVIVVARLLGRGADRIGLMPTPQRAPQPAQQLLPAMRGQT